MKRYLVLALLGAVFLQEPRAQEEMYYTEVVDTTSAALLDEAMERLYMQWQAQSLRLEPCDEDTAYMPPFLKDDVIRRLSALPNVIEMPYNQVVQSMINMYAGRRRKQVSYMLGLSSYYFPLFEEALEKGGLPLELKYLPVIESALNPQAYSRVGAAGLWQFMPGTGKLYGLEINSLVDERRDPRRATDAAVRYLKDLYSIYNDWLLVIAAYNCGPGNVNKAIRRANTSRDYWAIYNFLPRETRGYVPAFIAANYIMTYASDYKICPADVPVSPVVDTVTVTDRLHFEQLAAKLDITVDELRLLNPQYRIGLIPGNAKPYSLCMPTPLVYRYMENKDSIAACNRDAIAQRVEVDLKRAATSYTQNGVQYHKVRSGENLSVIAKRYRVSVKNLRAWNHLRTDNLSVGQRLRVSPGGASGSSRAQAVDNTAVASGEVYKVRPGDSLWSIAQRFGVTVPAIRAVNQPKDLNVLGIGQVIKLPKKK